MRNKIIVSLTAIICLGLAIFFGVFKFSETNIGNRRQDVYATDKFIDKTALDTTFYMFQVNEYVNNIRVEKGSIDSKTTSVDVVVEAKRANGSYTWDRLQCPISIKNGDTYILIGDALDERGYASVSSMSFVFTDEAGAPDASQFIEEFEINPTKLNFNLVLMFFVFLLPTVLVWAVLACIEDRVAFKKDIVSMKRYKYLLFDLVSRDIKTKYRRSALGVMWSVLNPLLMMLVLTAVFSQIIRVEVEGGFALFYLTGYILFNFVSESSGFSLTSIIHSGGLIRKVYIPKYVFPLEKTVFSLVNMMFSCIAFVIVFVIFLITGQVQLHATMLLFFVPMIYVFIFAFGLNLILSTLNLFFRDVGHIWSVFLTVWMYATPIIYPITLVPTWLQSIIKMNPLYYYVTYFRDVMIYGRIPSLTDNLICIGFALIFLAIGLVTFRKHQDEFILHL